MREAQARDPSPTSHGTRWSRLIPSLRECPYNCRMQVPHGGPPLFRPQLPSSPQGRTKDWHKCHPGLGMCSSTCGHLEICWALSRAWAASEPCGPRHCWATLERGKFHTSMIARDFPYPIGSPSCLTPAPFHSPRRPEHPGKPKSSPRATPIPFLPLEAPLPHPQEMPELNVALSTHSKARPRQPSWVLWSLTPQGWACSHSLKNFYRG